jgi:hypothetical protein
MSRQLLGCTGPGSLFSRKNAPFASQAVHESGTDRAQSSARETQPPHLSSSAPVAVTPFQRCPSGPPELRKFSRVLRLDAFDPSNSSSNFASASGSHRQRGSSGFELSLAKIIGKRGASAKRRIADGSISPKFTVQIVDSLDSVSTI